MGGVGLVLLGRFRGIIADKPGPPSPDVKIAGELAEVPAPVAFLPLGTFHPSKLFCRVTRIHPLNDVHLLLSTPPLSFPFASPLRTSLPFPAPFSPFRLAIYATLWKPASQNRRTDVAILECRLRYATCYWKVG
jgi:hypothetical protein